MTPSIKYGSYGLINSFAGNLLTSIGLICQQVVEQKIARTASLGSPYRFPLFILGVICVALGFVSSIVNYGLLPLSTQAPLSAQAIVYRYLLNWVVFGNVRIRAPMVFSLSCMALGIPIAMMGANLTDEEYFLPKVMDLMTQPLSVIFTVITAASLLLISQIWQCKAKKSLSTQVEEPMPTRSTMEEKNRLYRKYPELASGAFGLLYVCLTPAIAAGLFAVFTKIIVELMISAYFHNTSDFKQVATYLFLFPLPWLMSVKINYISKGLSCYHARLFLPVYQATTMMFNALCGMVYFLDFHTDAQSDLILYCIGLILAITGVLATILEFNPDRHIPTFGSEETNEFEPLIRKLRRKGRQRSRQLKGSSAFKNAKRSFGPTAVFDSPSVSSLGMLREPTDSFQFIDDESLLGGSDTDL